MAGSLKAASKHDRARDLSSVGEDHRIEEASRFRFRSVRSIRRGLERVMVEATMGLRPMSDITAMATGSKALAELFLAEKMLAKAGKDVEEDHPLGDAGGDREPPRMNNYVKRKFVIKEGINRFGKPVQEQHLTTEGDERAIREVEAEREARDAIEDMW